MYYVLIVHKEFTNKKEQMSVEVWRTFCLIKTIVEFTNVYPDKVRVHLILEGLPSFSCGPMDGRDCSGRVHFG